MNNHMIDNGTLIARECRKSIRHKLRDITLISLCTHFYLFLHCVHGALLLFGGVYVVCLSKLHLTFSECYRGEVITLSNAI